MRIETRVLVTGAGGFIGHALVNRLKAEGCFVRGVDIKYPEYESSKADEFEILDLRRWDSCLQATRGGIDQVYNLAADMGGIGYITAFHADFSRRHRPPQHPDQRAYAGSQPLERRRQVSVLVFRLRVRSK